MRRRASGVSRWNGRNVVYLLMLHCYGILLGSVLNLGKIERGTAHELSINSNHPFSCKLRVRGSNLATWEREVTHAP
jgi:hypothetical protein